MKPLFFIMSYFVIISLGFSQARDEVVDEYKTYLAIVITEENKEKIIIKEGEEISVKTEKGYVLGRWFFQSYPDVIYLKNKKGDVTDEFALNKQEMIRVVVQQAGPRLGIGVGIGPVGISSGNRGRIYNNYSMKNYTATIKEVLETRGEKIKREYIEKKEEERLLKETKRQERKDRRKKK